HRECLSSQLEKFVDTTGVCLMFLQAACTPNLIDVLYLRSKDRLQTGPEILNRLLISAQLDQLEVFRSYNGEPIGYLCYALVNAKAIRMIQLNRGIILDGSEWRSGRITFISDLHLSPAEKGLALSRLKEFL